MRVGCAMIGRGELGFQLATTAKADGILTADAYSATIWALLLATLIGPFAFRLSMKYTPWGLEEKGGEAAAAAVVAAAVAGDGGEKSGLAGGGAKVVAEGSELAALCV